MFKGNQGWEAGGSSVLADVHVRGTCAMIQSLPNAEVKTILQT